MIGVAGHGLDTDWPVVQLCPHYTAALGDKTRSDSGDQLTVTETRHQRGDSKPSSGFSAMCVCVCVCVCNPTCEPVLSVEMTH